jgi:hypothetical protein
MFAFVFPIGLVSFLYWICSETSKATAFDFYDGIYVFWIQVFVPCLLHLVIVTLHSSIPLHGWIPYSYKEMPILVLSSNDLGIILSFSTMVVDPPVTTLLVAHLFYHVDE